MNITRALLLIFCVLTFTLSCEEQNSNVRNEVRMEREPSDAEIKDTWLAEKETLRNKLKETTDQLDKLIRSPEQTSDKTSTFIAPLSKTEVEELKKRKNLLETDLRQIDQQVVDNWDEFKTNVGEHIEDAQNIIKQNS